MRPIFLFFLLCFATAIFSQSNSLPGYWQVDLVTVGENNMTPVGKWFHLGPEGDLQGGNCGSINLFGSWQNTPENELLFMLQSGEPDPAGPFSMSWEGEQLILQRMEEGQPIQVVLQAFEPGDWPMAPWDQIAGGWKIASQDPANQKEMLQFNTVFFQWDNNALFNRGNDGVRTWSALWRIHAHRPQLELAPRGGHGTILTWYIEFGEDQMIWSRVVDDQEQRLVWEKQG